MQDKSYQYIVAYGIAIIVFVMISKTKTGYSILYYSLVLALMFLLVTQANTIVSYLTPIMNKNAPIIIPSTTTASGSPTV
jgi:ABC-type polysaccharide/polyol phosphate export permease